MAIYEIARIQLRRGRANNGTGIPQLASGELAWAIDTQELFIGNGAISEGAPTIGNTRILTDNDLNQYGFFGETCITASAAPWQTGVNYNKGQIVSNNISETGSEAYTYVFLCIESHVSNDFATDLTASKWQKTPYIYTYKKSDVITSVSEATPVVRCIEDRLSDRVSLLDFVTINDINSGDYTAALQRAILNLFNIGLDQPHEHKASTDPSYRVNLEIPAGVYSLSSTIRIPSYANIIGAGSSSTIFNYIGTTDNNGPIFTFEDPTNEQPKYIKIKGFTINLINSAAKDYTVIQLENVYNSIFEDISINDNWNGVYDPVHSAISLTGMSDIITCEKNTFSDIKINGFAQGIKSDDSIKNNHFNNISISDAKYGFILGNELPIYTLKHNSIDKCTFTGIHAQAVFIISGYNNNVTNCRLINVGNNTSGTNETTPIYPQVYFNTPNNLYQDNCSERSNWLSQLNTEQQFIPEVSGSAVKYSNYGTCIISNSLNQTENPILVIKLPLRTDASGNIEKIINCRIEYNYETTNYIRRGLLTIVADYDQLLSEFIQLVDELDYLGLVDDESALKLRFHAKFIDITGREYINGPDIAGIGIFYSDDINPNNLPSGTLTYSYTVNY